MKKINTTIKAMIIWGLLLSVILVGLFIVRKENQELEMNPVYDYAVIVEMYVGTKARDFVKYEFRFGNEIFYGSQSYMAHKECILIGDSCEVVYASTNPKINRLLTYENKFLKIKINQTDTLFK